MTIVGGGYTGVAAAVELARAGRLVAILEANALGSGASSRNGGMIGSGHRVALDGLAQRYGENVEAPVTLGLMRRLVPVPSYMAATEELSPETLDSLFPGARTHVWKGNVGMTSVDLPHLGRHQGLHYALGYSGSVVMAPYLGFKIALQLLGDARGETAFDRIEFKALPLYSGNPWFLRCMEWRMRIADRREGSV
ncbi:MAG: FAD-dependent oxidoreductase [Gammaproteobacteria bacterium]|nr:FAD-dependent oxidoreductase [Gammaproteobacteria bacterium]